MEWKIDTSKTGEVLSSGLRGALEASRDHFIDTQAEAAGLAASASLGAGPDGKADPAGAMAHMKKIEAAASPLVAAHRAKSTELVDAMNLGIAQACAQADFYASKHPQSKVFVTATVAGHDNPRHASGVAMRTSVQVDLTWKE